MMRSRSSKRIWRRKERGSHGPASERGTVLLMVIGVLAMLAILAIVYASIGQADRRTSSAYARSAQVIDISGQIGDYIADIIGKDATTPFVEEFAGNRQREARVTWTYPSIDYNNDVKSNPTIGGGLEFKPYGGGFQPWLAPNEPTFLRFNGTTPWTDQDRQYLDFRDWLTISNVAPNGQFVNLANLRNNFFAEPGIGNDANNRPRMSVGLTLYGNDALGRPQNAANPNLLDGTNADPNIPWHWTAWQRHAARPITNFRNDPGQANPGQNEFIQNQWADADGDGIADARWFELNSAVGPFAQWVSQSLTQQDKARYFAAVRIVDLSGMTNISTAMDLLVEPSPVADADEPVPYPLGVTPADTDLLRRLTLADAYQRYGVGYNVFMQPTNPTDPGFYTQYLFTTAAPAAGLVGRAAYANLQFSIASDRLDPNGNPTPPRPTGQIPGLNTNGQNFTDPFDITAERRASLYFQSQLDPGHIGYSTNVLVYDPANANNPPSLGYVSRQPFGMAEELELHAFFSANDPRESSRLEAVLDGRRNVSGAGNIYPTFGPLRAPRGHDVERDRRGVVRADGQQDDTSLAQQHLDLRHTITTYNAARPFTYLRPQRSFDPDLIGDNEVRVNLTPFLHARNSIPNTALGALFNHAADALMPYRNIAPADNLWNPTDPQATALHYARSAEFAVRSAAHWTLNLRDAVDDDNAVFRVGGAPDDDVRGPSVMTLRTLRTASTTRSPQYPWDQLTLDNANVELAANAANLQSSLVNIYGIEAQPVLCEAASYAWWTDMPHNVRTLSFQSDPDNEWEDNRDPDGPGGPLPPQDTPITIDDDVSAANPDFLGEVVAFQITNPFDRDITLTRAGAASPEILYYVEYANRYFPLAEVDNNAAGFALANVDLELRAGETRVFFATSPRREINFNARFEIAETGTNRTTVDVSNFLRDWVNTQFRGVGVTDQRDAVHTTMFDPETFALSDPEPGANSDPNDGIMDLHGEFTSPPASLADRTTVKLWRVMRHRLDDAPNTPNLRTNDLLADRMRDPTATEPTLFQRLDSAPNNEVPSTVAGDDSGRIFPPPNRQDNTGFTITMWGAVRRPTRVPGVEYRGAMPPWAIEAREDQFYAFSHSNSTRNPDPRFLNALESGPPNRGSGPDYRNSARSQYVSLADMVNDQTDGTGGTRINDQMRHKAENKTGNEIPLSQSRDAQYSLGRPFEAQAVRIALGGRDRTGEEWNAGLYKRLGDLLLPLAIGPYHDPNSRTGDDRMCLTEALALATDYYSPPDTHLYHHAGHLDTTAGDRPKLDRGHFVIDDFVPFNDRDGNGAFNPSASNKEEPLGLGIPIALNLLDKFRLDGIAGKAKGESGKTNINTATLMSTSVLPLLTPDPLVPWMIDDVGDREPLYVYGTHPADRAASILSYRDKLDMRTRPTMSSVTADVATPNANATIEVSFRDTTATPQLTQPWLHDGRQNRNLIPNIREQRGFRSPGEILAVLLRDLPVGATNDPYRSNSMDFYGFDLAPIEGHREIDANHIPDYGTPAISDDAVNDEIIDDYGEKIAIANAAIGSITTRSDTFCVWFVLHGYQQSDVENLGPRDPLIPTLAKRYMMIVDRTNVVKKGDKPRILMFREVPL